MDNIRPLALYLPQYHSIPENDANWGKGFTEWTNVRKATPLFEGHYQPHIPHPSVGYYDLNDVTVLHRQAAMAKAHGIYGFAYYHYWFNGKRLLNKPLDDMLANPELNMPFCYIWANENWTKRWDGRENEIIIAQTYRKKDDYAHIQFLCEKVFSDPRYIRIENKPLFIVYRTELLPNIAETAHIWRSEAKNFGFKDLYLVRVEGMQDTIDPKTIGFDAAMEFAPNWNEEFKKKHTYAETKIQTSDYWLTVLNMLQTKREYTRFRCVFPSWDNSPRRGSNAKIFIDDKPAYFQYFLRRQIQNTRMHLPKHMPYLFINAWNEWGEGCHLEPDTKNDYLYLNICKDELLKEPQQHTDNMNLILAECLDGSNQRIADLVSQIRIFEKRKRKFQLLNKFNVIKRLIDSILDKIRYEYLQ